MPTVYNLGNVTEDVSDDAHRRYRWVDVGVADHELLQDVVLNRSRQQLRSHSLRSQTQFAQLRNRRNGRGWVCRDLFLGGGNVHG